MLVAQYSSELGTTLFPRQNETQHLANAFERIGLYLSLTVQVLIDCSPPNTRFVHQSVGRPTSTL
jgi:hypothetical protein